MKRNPFVMSLALSAAVLSTPVALAEKDASEHVQELVDAMLDDVANKTEYACQCGDPDSDPKACPTMNSPRAKLAAMFSGGPEFFAAFEPIAVDAMRSKSTTEDQGGALVGLLLESRNAAVVPVAEAMYEAAPERFCCGSLLGFCELGSESLVKPLTQQVKKGKAGVPAAAFVAVQGDKTAKRLLKKARDAKTIDASNALDVLIAAHALEALGDDGCLRATQVRVHEAAMDALDTDDLDDARALAVAAAIVDRATRTRNTIYSLVALRYHNQLESLKAHDELVQADDIFELIESSTPMD